MELTAEHIAFIRQDVRSRGITLEELVDSLTDHICCAMENHPGTDFHTVYAAVLGTFGESGLYPIQEETILLSILKKEVTMKRTMFILGYIAAFLITTGLLFRLQHWPGATVMLVLGMALLNFGFLPMFFYSRYKKAVS